MFELGVQMNAALDVPGDEAVARTRRRGGAPEVVDIGSLKNLADVRLEFQEGRVSPQLRLRPARGKAVQTRDDRLAQKMVMLVVQKVSPTKNSS